MKLISDRITYREDLEYPAIHQNLDHPSVLEVLVNRDIQRIPYLLSYREYRANRRDLKGNHFCYSLKLMSK